MRTRCRLLPIGLIISSILVGSACAPAPTTNQAQIDATIAAAVQETTVGQSPAPATTQTTDPLPDQATPAQEPTTPAAALPSATTFAPATAADSAATPTTATALPNATAAGVAGSSGTTAPTGDAADTDAAPAAELPVFAPATAGATSSTVNIELVFDASGSMAQLIGNETKIDAARRAINTVIAGLPDDNATLNVGFRVFGHRGDNTDAGRALSCQSTELLVPVQGVDKALLQQQAQAWEPTGWTPITLALTEAASDLSAGENVRNVIIMVTDGEETCDGDPCAAALALAQSDAEVRIDVVGFGDDPTLQDSLGCISTNSGGTYTDVQDGDALAQTIEQLITATIQRSYLRIVVVGPDGQPIGEASQWQGGVGVTNLTDGAGNRVPLLAGELAGEGRRTPIEDRGEQRFELPPGRYQFTVQQQLGYLGMRGNLPQQNDQQTYAAEVGAGQETVARVGLGALTLDSAGGDLAYACDLALDIALDERWQPAYAAPAGFCSRSNPAVVQGGDLAFDRPYPLLPGRYRLRDAERNTVITDTIVIEPGKTVRVQVQQQ